MRGARWALTLTIVCFTLAGCGSSAPGTSPETDASGTLGQNLLVEASGSLAYKHPGWRDYSPLTFGMSLVRGDLLQVPSDGEGLLVCADLSLVPLEPGYLGGVPCSEENQILKRGDSLVLAPQRGASASDSIPVLLQPRHTLVREPNPLIRWTPTPSAGEYTIRVWGGDLDWRVQTTSTELRYPPEAPELVPGTTYRVTITDDSGRSSDDEATALDLGFVLLPPDEVSDIDTLERQAEALGLAPEASRLVEAEILVTRGLRAEAIAVLDELATGEAPSLFQRLGTLYLEVGLYSESGQCFEKALAGFRSLGMPAWEAAALAGLGQAQRGDGNGGEARTSLEMARQIYRDLGDDEGLGHVEKLLEDLGSE